MHRCLVFILILWTTATVFTGCTLKQPPVPTGVIPNYLAPTPRARVLGRQMFEALGEDYEVKKDHSRYGQLRKTLNRLLSAIGAEPVQWQVFVFDEAELIDVRAVVGNYIFVWSGFLDFVQNDDEIAAILACEIAHVLADHTKPVEFTVLSKVFFRTAELATSVGLIVLSQGAIAFNGQGWMEYIYVEAADLDPLDREYHEKQEEEALAIACLILDRSGYDPKALMTFWTRVQETQGVTEKTIRLNRSVAIEKRMALLAGLIPDSHPVGQDRSYNGQHDPADQTVQDNIQSGTIDLFTEIPVHR